MAALQAALAFSRRMLAGLCVSELGLLPFMDVCRPTPDRFGAAHGDGGQGWCTGCRKSFCSPLLETPRRKRAGTQMCCEMPRFRP